MKTYLNILQHILDNGYTKMDRTGTGTIGVFGVTLRHKMSDGFPLLSTKKMFTKGIICELLWFLNGDTNIKYLLENNVHIWSEWPWKHYCTWVKSENKRSGMGVTPLTLKEFEDQILKDESFAAQWGGIGDGYGAQWRKWPGRPTDGDGEPLNFTDGGFGDNSLIDYVQPNYDGESAKVKMKPIDQITNLIDSLKNNPLSRRHIVTAWNPAEIENMLLPPCHMLFQLNCRPLTLTERYSNWPDFQNKVAGHDYIKARWTEDKDGKRTYYADDTFKTPITEEENTANKHAYLDSQNVPKYHLDLMLTQRSCDVFFGIPYNIASYSLLLHMLSQQCNMVPGEFIHSMGDVHIYNNLIEQSKEQLTREPYPLPTLKLNKAKDIFSYKLEDFVFENYQCHPAIKGEIAV